LKTLKIAKNLSLPLETVTQAIAILAKRRAGKSFTMRRIVEQLFAADQQVDRRRHGLEVDHYAP